MCLELPHGVLEASWSVLEALGGVLEVLEVVLKASWRRLGDKHEPRCQKIEERVENNIEQTNENEGFWPMEVGAQGRGRRQPGGLFESFFRKDLGRSTNLFSILNTPMTHQGGLAD